MVYIIKCKNGSDCFISSESFTLRETLSEAKIKGIKLHYADLRTASLQDLNLTMMDLCGSDFTDANIQDTNLSHANLAECDFTNANLYGADFSGADLSNIITAPQWIIQGQIRSDGRAFFLQRLAEDDFPMVKVGPIYLSIKAAIAWYSVVEGTRGNPEETRIIIQAMVDTMKVLGLK